MRGCKGRDVCSAPQIAMRRMKMMKSRMRTPSWTAQLRRLPPLTQLSEHRLRELSSLDHPSCCSNIWLIRTHLALPYMLLLNLLHGPSVA
eukprot:6488735-Amphidinium_carterae.5